jgi:hypothetical protein
MWERIKKLIPASGAIWPLIAFCAILALLYLRFAPTVRLNYQPDRGPVTVAPEPKTVTKTVTRIVTVPGPERIVYLNRPEAALALKMPELNQGSDNVLAVATVAPHSGKTTVVSMLSPTGEGTILLRQEPTPFWQVRKDFRATVRYLFVGTNLIESELVASPLRTGPVEWEAGAGVEIRREDSTLGARGWIGASYRF